MKLSLLASQWPLLSIGDMDKEINTNQDKAGFKFWHRQRQVGKKTLFFIHPNNNMDNSFSFSWNVKHFKVTKLHLNLRKFLGNFLHAHSRTQKTICALRFESSQYHRNPYLHTIFSNVRVHYHSSHTWSETIIPLLLRRYHCPSSVNLQILLLRSLPFALGYNLF